MVDFFLLVIVIWFIGLGVAYKIYSSHKAKIQAFAEASSLRYLECKRLNREYESHFIQYGAVFTHRVIVNTRQKVDAFDFYPELGRLLSSNFKIDLAFIENCISSNQYWYRLYQLAYDQLPDYRTEKQFRSIPGKKPHMSYEEYAEAEREMAFPMLHPELSFRVDIKVSYTSPKGHSHHERSRSFSIEDCKKYLSIMEKQEHERDYRDEERKKMTQALRYEVLRRDGFRCTICGRGSADGVKLHVDHIRPVSKGGKTELPNLRTLCQDCNLGKSNRWNPDGVN